MVRSIIMIHGLLIHVWAVFDSAKKLHQALHDSLQLFFGDFASLFRADRKDQPENMEWVEKQERHHTVSVEITLERILTGCFGLMTLKTSLINCKVSVGLFSLSEAPECGHHVRGRAWQNQVCVHSCHVTGMDTLDLSA